MSATDFLETIRLAELSRIKAVLDERAPRGAAVLEIGAGTGWQARELSRLNYAVTAIDIPTSNHGKARIWPIIDFDGSHIPFADASFDIVYSSNVLEHVEDLETLNSEMARVLRQDGYAIHYVPTSAWRAWSLVAFYPALAFDACRRLKARFLHGEAAATLVAADAGTSRPRSGFRKLVRRILPHAHGARGTYWSELGRFKRSSWDHAFLTSGWTIVGYGDNGLFLTGDMLLGAWIPVSWRKRLSSVLGCTAHLYVLRRTMP